MVEIINWDKNLVEIMMQLRCECLRSVIKDISVDFGKDFLEMTECYFREGNQFTVIAVDGERPVGCATVCLVDMLPTLSHPSCKRGHIMNVYVNEEYRRQGIGRSMIKRLVEYVKKWHITHISLDATEDGKGLYEKLGFVRSNEYMEMEINY